MKKLELTQNKFAIVDADDFEYLNQWRWYFNNGYARRELGGGKKVYLHWVVNKTPKGTVTDHINGDTLDNRKSNLRSVTKKINVRNHKLFVNNSSGHNGISWNKAIKKWEVYIWKDNKKIKLGYFRVLDLAIEERRLGELKYWND